MAIVTSVIDGVMFGVDLSRVDAIAYVDDELPEEEESFDIARLWDLAPPEPRSRRVLLVRTTLGRRQLLVGDLAQVESVAPSAVRALPQLIEGVARRAAILGIFFVDTEIGYLVDVDRLASHERGPTAHGGEGAP